VVVCGDGCCICGCGDGGVLVVMVVWLCTCGCGDGGVVAYMWLW